MDIFVEFLLSMKWCILILVIAIIRFLKNIMRYMESKQTTHYIEVVRDAKIDADEVLKSLDKIIEEALDEYVITMIKPKNIYYISTEMEKEILAMLADQVPERISQFLMDKLSLIYNREFIGSMIGGRIYFTVMNFVLEYNLTNENNKK